MLFSVMTFPELSMPSCVCKYMYFMGMRDVIVESPFIGLFAVPFLVSLVCCLEKLPRGIE